MNVHSVKNLWNLVELARAPIAMEVYPVCLSYVFFETFLLLKTLAAVRARLQALRAALTEGGGSSDALLIGGLDERVLVLGGVDVRV